MIAKSYIEKNLAQLEHRYNSAKTQYDHVYFSKLAILELCGWIEISMDDLIFRAAKSSCNDPKNLKYMEKDVIKRNYGFSYERHFKGMIVQLIGITGMEKLEKAVDQTKRLNLESQLGDLHIVRNEVAHTYIKGVTSHLEAPSRTFSRFNQVYSGLIEYDDKIRIFT